MKPFTAQQYRVLKKVLLDYHFQGLIGSDEWSLTEGDEEILWDIITDLEEDED